MYYKEFLLLRRALIVFFAIVLALGILQNLATLGKGRQHIDISELLLFTSAWLAAIFGAIYGTSIGQECSDNARFALMRPISRWRSALNTFGPGIGAVVLALVCSAVIFEIPSVLIGGVHIISNAHGYGWIEILFPLGLALAFYAAGALASTFSRRSVGIAFFPFPIAAFLYVFSFTPGGIHQVLEKLNFINPFAYYISGINALSNPKLASQYGAFGLFTPTQDMWALFGLFALFISIAMVRYQRMEV